MAEAAIALFEPYTSIFISSIGFDINSRPQAEQRMSCDNTCESGILITEKVRVLKIDLLQLRLKQ